MNRFIKNIIAFSLKNRFIIFFSISIIVIWGIISYLRTPVEAFPDVTNTEIIIITQWSGRSAEEIERYVTIPIEIEMNSAQKKTDVRSITLFGLSVVYVVFDDNVDDAFARQQVNNLLMNVDLPEGIKAEVEPPSGPTSEVFRYTLRSNSRSIRELKTIQDWVIERQIRSIQGVADVVSFGGEVKTYEIQVDPNLLAKYDITPLEVYQAVNRSNINVGGDVIEHNTQAYVVRGIGVLDKFSEIGDIVIKNINGSPLLVKNVATVQESNLPRLGQVGINDKSDVIEGIILMRKGQNPSEVIQKVKAKINDLNNKILPSDVKMVTFYNREDLIHYATHTVLHNLIEGIIFVTVIVLLFMADWRTTLVVSLIIPLALLFAFICLKLKGMSANLLSMGAIDFGIIIDGAVVMVEGIFVALDRKAEEIGMTRFNRISKLGLIKDTGAEMGKSILISKLIIITALMPIFSFQKVEGKMFSPLAYTLGFALLGALIFALTLAPVMSSYLFNKNVREKNNPFLAFVMKITTRVFDIIYANKRIALIASGVVLALTFFSFKFLGTEFLPQLNEGAIYVRASLPMSVSLSESVKISEDMRHIFMSFPEVKQVLSQTGRPNDGTDPTGFYNIEFHVDIYHTRKMELKKNREDLINRMVQKLSKYPGIDFNFSQPIQDNVEEAVSGVKGSLAVKIYGDNLDILDQKADSVYNIMKDIRGVADLGLIRNIGQPEYRIELDENKMALYNVATADCQAVIEMAIGGKAASTFYEGYRKFDIRIRYKPEFRTTDEEIGNLLVPTLSGTQIPIKEIATIRKVTGPILIFRDNNQRFIALKFSARGRDMGSTVREAQKKVNEAIKLPKGYTISWEGDFENQQRASRQLSLVVPISLIVIFLILFILYGNVLDAGLILVSVPFAIVGGILALHITSTNFCISAGIGFIALFGISIQNNVILLSKFKKNLHEKMELDTAIRTGVIARIRPVAMTALLAAIGLFPAAISTGIGSESSKPLAIVVIGGLVTATTLTLFIFPIVFKGAYKYRMSRSTREEVAIV
ncbi:MAG TPA: CusA/CzcA family heavy metal efflux RND transporter [Bacteroidales bacterium]|nr:CusA/CzcA family heavy metal efflux RND transporter [Bacteroidales bacterium]